MMRDTTRYVTIECWRCLGAGFVEKFRHILGGVCFVCRGQRRVVLPAWKLERLSTQFPEESSTQTNWRDKVVEGDIGAAELERIEQAARGLDRRARDRLLRFLPHSLPLEDVLVALKTTSR